MNQMESENLTGEGEQVAEKMSISSGKIQRSVSSMIKQMEMTDEEVKYRMEHFESADSGKQYSKYLKYLKCTKCNLSFHNIINRGKEVGVHPLLGVLLCDSCCDYYGDGNFSLDSEGEDKYCRWCGQGGTIFACSKCICGFCENCIRKHFGKNFLEQVKSDDDWVCFFCNPRPLWYLRSICSLAKEAAKNKKECLEYSREARSLKKNREEEALNSCSSDNASIAGDSIKQKKVKLIPKKFSRDKERSKRDSSSSDEAENVMILKSRRKDKKKSWGRNATEESSGSDARNPKKRARTADYRNGGSELEAIKSPLLEKLKSIWKLTQTTTEVGLKSSRERLLNLSRTENFTSLESLRKEHDELKSCIKVLVSTLGVVSSSADSIGEDLRIDTAKDDREIFQSQESKLKRFAKRFEEKSDVETSVDMDAPSKVELVEEKRKGKEEMQEKKRKWKEKEVEKGADGGGENGPVSESQSEEGQKLQKEYTPAKPLLKVKSFAKMLDENVYDKNKKTMCVNGECELSEKSPVVIDLYEEDSEESGMDSQKKGEPVVGEKAKTESSEDSSKKSPEIAEDKPMKEGNSSMGNKRSDVEKEKCKEQTGSSDQKETEKLDVEEKRRKKKKKGEKKKKKESSENEFGSEGIETATEEAKKGGGLSESGNGESEAVEKREELPESEKEANELGKEEAEKKARASDDEKNAISEEGTEKETPSGDKKDNNSSLDDEVEKKDSESEKEKKSSGEKLSEEKFFQRNTKRDSSSEGDSSGGEEKNQRITRNKKKKEKELKASFAEYKQQRERFLKSGKGDPQKKKVNALDSSDSEGETKVKSGMQKKMFLTSSDEERVEHAKESEISDGEGSEKETQKTDSDMKTAESEETSSDEMSTRHVKRERLRRKNSSGSSEKDTKSKKKKDSGSESSEEDSKKKNKGRKNIKKILKKDSLKIETKEALKNEEERKKRLKERQKLFEETFPDQRDFTQLKHLVLDFDPNTKKPLVTVHKKLVRKLKPHQVMGVKFMWDSCFESVQRMEEDNGSGCILAHCMGLGKTLQVITLVHTVMTHDLGLNTVMIVCPLSTVSNWLREFEVWLADIHTDPITLYDLVKYKKLEDRRFYLKDWQESGGVLVISYDLFRNLTKGLNKKKSQRQRAFESALLDPGPDLVICDEGHLLKNEDTALSKCMSRVKTSRRIVLTGTPLQNNLIEYHCMVQFVKPNILGTKKEFCNRFVNPINNGQFEDSTELDVKIMKRRSHVLHSMLDGCIQRFDYSVLTPFLPEKHEYVLSIELTDTQAKAYRHFISRISAKSCGNSRAASLFTDYHCLQRIWTHPRTMLMHGERENLKEDEESEGSLKDFIVSSEEESASSKSDDSSSSIEEVTTTPRRITRSNANDPEVLEAMEKEEMAPKKKWWDEFYEESAYDDLRESNKLLLLFDLLRHCKKVKDKVLVFSQSLYSLDVIEYFLNRVSENRDKDNEQLCGHEDTWVLGRDYFRLDGSTTSERRTMWCSYFNKKSNTRARLFLLSTKAGGLGINLHGANRVVIFDASWNPSHDLQSIFRVYRFGQKKTCYVYRFLAEATMEEKIYERQVTKLSLAHRVVDEHQIERHYTMGNLQALYTFEPTPREARKVPKLPKDPVLADLLAAHKNLIVGYHEHDSLLENKQEEELSEEERKVAWKEYEEEKAQKSRNLDPLVQQQMLLLMQQARLSQAAAGALELNPMYMQSAITGRTVINPIHFQPNPNIPLGAYQRGIKVGLMPAPNESLESYIMRILQKEDWIMSGGKP